MLYFISGSAPEEWVTLVYPKTFRNVQQLADICAYTRAIDLFSRDWVVITPRRPKANSIHAAAWHAWTRTSPLSIVQKPVCSLLHIPPHLSAFGHLAILVWGIETWLGAVPRRRNEYIEMLPSQKFKRHLCDRSGQPRSNWSPTCQFTRKPLKIAILKPSSLKTVHSALVAQEMCAMHVHRVLNLQLFFYATWLTSLN